MREFTYAGRTVVLTGAAGGIGAALARDLGRRGCSLALVDRDAAGLAAVVAQIAAAGGAGTLTTHLVDLADGADREDLAADVLAAHGGIDLLVNNAGVALAGRFDQISMADFDWVMTVNFRASVAMTKAFLPALQQRPGAHIANVSSIFGIAAPPGQTAYAASKFAVRGFSEALRAEVASDGIGVTVVHPGGVRTNIGRAARIGAGVPPAQVEAGLAAMNKLLTLPPETAATLILESVRRRRPRVVITRQAQMVDAVVRLAPGRYWQLLGPLLRGGRRR